MCAPTSLPLFPNTGGGWAPFLPLRNPGEIMKSDHQIRPLVLFNGFCWGRGKEWECRGHRWLPVLPTAYSPAATLNKDRFLAPEIPQTLLPWRKSCSKAGAFPTKHHKSLPYELDFRVTAYFIDFRSLTLPSGYQLSEGKNLSSCTPASPALLLNPFWIIILDFIL